MAEMASRRAAQLILQLAGGDLAHGAVAAGTSGVKTLQLSMRFKRFHEIVGIPVASDRAIAILSALGFTPWTEEGIEFKTTDDDQLFVRVPPHRLDVDREIDLIEEVARVHGYHNIPTLDRVTHAVSPESTRERAMKAIRSAMVECGFNEAVTLTFIPAAQAEPFAQAFRGTAIHSQHNGWKSEALRPSLLPSLLAVRRTNQYAGIPDAHVFETAATFLQQGDPQTPPLERRTLSAVAGDLTALTGMLRLLAQRLNPATSVRVSPQDFPFYIRGTSGEVILQAPDGTSATGNVGLFTPELQKQFDLRHAAAGCELDLEPLINIFQPIRRAQPVPRYPGVTRDLSIVVEEAVRWADVENAINATGLPHLDNIDFVTTFRNAQIGEGKKSLTLTLEFRDPARTLTSEEVDAQMKSAIELLTKQFNAALRT
jgi:phenylalanyl-tRNA synthetase beta chain